MEVEHEQAARQQEQEREHERAERQQDREQREIADEIARAERQMARKRQGEDQSYAKMAMMLTVNRYHDRSQDRNYVRRYLSDDDDDDHGWNIVGRRKR